MTKSYEAPNVYALGTVSEMTQIDKCGGSGDQFLPQILSERFSLNCQADRLNGL